MFRAKFSLGLARRSENGAENDTVAGIIENSLAQIPHAYAFSDARSLPSQHEKVFAVQQLSPVQNASRRLAMVTFSVGVIAFLRYSDILLDNLATTAGYGLYGLTQELWMFCR